MKYITILLPQRERNPPFGLMSICHMTLSFDNRYHFIHVLLANILLRGFHHDAEDRLSAGLPYQNAAGVAQLLGNL